MYRELGLLVVLLLPVLLVYLFQQSHTQTNSKKGKKSKKKNKKKTASTANSKSDSSASIISNSNNNGDSNCDSNSLPTAEKEEDAIPFTSDASITNSNKKQQIAKFKKVTGHKQPYATEPQERQEQTEKQKGTKSSSSSKIAKSDFPPLTTTSRPSRASQQQQRPSTKEREVDEHMDLTARYSRVIRIRTETPEETLSPVPHEEGWNQVKAKPQQSSGTGNLEDEPLTKKQRYNQMRAARKKEAKAQADALQEQRLRQHQRQLENEKIKAFYSTGAGKNTPWGSKPAGGSSKSVNSKAGLNEHGQLIWD